MWKVKRMDTARIVVLTTADGIGGIAAYLAHTSDNTPLAAEPVARPPSRAPGLTKTLTRH
jgi:pilus assembly protein CpaB